MNNSGKFSGNKPTPSPDKPSNGKKACSQKQSHKCCCSMKNHHKDAKEKCCCN